MSSDIEAMADNLLRVLGLNADSVAGTVHFDSPETGVRETLYFATRLDTDGTARALFRPTNFERVGFVELNGALTLEDMRLLTVSAFTRAAGTSTTDLATCYDGQNNERLTLTMEPASVRAGTPAKAYYECGHDPSHYYDYTTGAQLPGKP